MRICQGQNMFAKKMDVLDGAAFLQAEKKCENWLEEEQAATYVGNIISQLTFSQAIASPKVTQLFSTSHLCFMNTTQI